MRGWHLEPGYRCGPGHDHRQIRRLRVRLGKIPGRFVHHGSNANAYPAGISRNTVLLAFASLFADISSEMLYPILPIFLTQVLHASGSVVGVVEGIAEATQNVVQGFSGWLSDKLHKRKALALIAYFVSALGKPLMGIATAWPGVLGGRFLDRFGAGFRSAPRDALIASSVSDEYRGRAFGLEGIGDNLGAFLGPLLAVLLFLSFDFSPSKMAVVSGKLACASSTVARASLSTTCTPQFVGHCGLKGFDGLRWIFAAERELSVK
jgi:MFS family permease